MRPEVGETAGKGSPQESARVPANTRGCARKKANSELLTFIYWWTEEEINARLERILTDAFSAIWQVAQEKQVSLRTATFIIACHRVLEARAERGLYP